MIMSLHYIWHLMERDEKTIYNEMKRLYNYVCIIFDITDISF